jgi:signal transduction histidine kinase
MVERTEVVRSARRTAERVVEAAEDRARAMRLETEDYIDQKLAGFEVVLDRTMAAVQKGRERLQIAVESPVEAAPSEADEAGAAFFDQEMD